jgi:hypothetical protein
LDSATIEAKRGLSSGLSVMALSARDRLTPIRSWVTQALSTSARNGPFSWSHSDHRTGLAVAPVSTVIAFSAM